jgi:Calcium binding
LVALPEQAHAPTGQAATYYQEALKRYLVLRKGEIVEVRRLAPEDACASDMLVLIRWQGRNLATPLSQLAGADADEPTAEAIGDWHYWITQGYRF